jgi:hypothetical protein
MIEAIACGTPVIAWRNGAVPEVIEDGVTGFVVDSLEDVVHAVDRVGGLSRHACRSVFEERYDAARMAHDYLEVYRRLAHTGTELVRAMPYDADPLSGPAAQRPDRRRVSRSYVPLLWALPGINSQALGADSTGAGVVRALTGKR